METELKLDCLGGLRLTLDEKPLALPSLKARLLLCYLALSGRPQAREALAGLLWSELSEEAARANLRTMLPKLRRIVGSHLTIGRDTVAFDRASAYELDVELFLNNLTGLADDADVTRLREAVDLYRGDFLADVQLEDAPLFEEWLLGQRERLKQLAVQALHVLAAHHTERQEWMAATDYLGRLLGLEPWREDSHRQLMTMLALSGQRDAALAQFEACRRTLREELGLEPSAETARLYERISSGSLSAQPPPGPRLKLPAPLTPLLGRADELTQLCERLKRSSQRLITLHGPGGVGKTRLALAVASELADGFSDGVHFVNLAAVTVPERVLATIAESMSLTDRGVGGLEEALRHKHLLLVLDNFEQVTPAAPAITDLLSACPQLHVVVTSRSALNVRGEHRFSVSPLPVPDTARLPDLPALRSYPTVALFAERAEAVNSAFSLTEKNAPAVAAICARLDGLPLAIELAAARVNAFLPHEILNRMSSRMAFLTGGATDVSARQRTLQGAVSWSYELLNDQEKRLFERLSVFVGGATLEAAEAVCCADGSAGEVVEGVTSLLNASLLGRSEGRFVMLETLREFARARLDERGATDTQRAHARYFLTMAESAVLTGAEQGMWLDRLEEEHDNLRAALSWTVEHSETDMGLRFTEPLWHFWHMRGYLNEGRAWLEALLALPHGDEPTEGRARALNGAGVLAWMQGDYETARVYLGESLGIRRALGNTPRVAAVLNNLGIVAYLQGEYAEAQRLYEESLALYQLVDPAGIHGALGNLSLVVFLQGDYTRAREMCEEVLAHFRAANDDWRTVTSLNNLARVVRRQGDDAYAASLLLEGLTLGRSVGAARVLADLVEKVAGLVAVRGEPDTAARLWGAAEAYRERLGAPMEPVSRPGYERDVAMAKALSHERAFEAAWLEGRATGFEKAVDEALEYTAA